MRRSSADARPQRGVARTMRWALFAAASLALASTPGFAQTPGHANLVVNGDFAQVAGGKPARWETSGNPRDVDMVLRADKDEAGKPCAVLACTRCEPKTPSSHAMLCQIGGASIVKGRLYEFSCRMRAEDLKRGSVSVSLQETKGWLPSGLSSALAVGPAWKTQKVLFYAERDMGATARLQFWFTEPGVLYVADVSLVEKPKVDADFTDVVPDVGGRNLIFNSSFELGGARWSTLGQGAGWGDLARLHGVVETTGGAHGKSFLRIPLGGRNTPVLGFDYYEPVFRRELRPLAANLGWVKVTLGEAYTVSCSLRASQPGVRATLGARSRNPEGWYRDYRQSVALTADWKRYSFTFKPVHRYAFVVAGPDIEREEDVAVDVDAVQLEKGERATEYTPRGLVEFALEPSQPGGIFVSGEPAALRLRGANYSGTSVSAPATFDAKDFDDRPVPLAGAPLDLPANSSATREVKLPIDWRGFYRVRASFAAETSPVVRVAVVAKRSSDDGVLGINHAFSDPALIRLASKFGVTWYRDWSLKWQHLEPVKGEFHWDVGDAQIDRVVSEGAHVLSLMPPFPSADWSSEAPDGLPTTGYPGVRLRQAWAPKDPRDLADFIGRAVGRYKDRVRVWEFLNEPIYTSYALPADRANQYGGKKYAPADYVSLLEVAARAMKKTDPACRVIGGIAGGPELLTREVIEAGCLKHVDLFNLHGYPGQRRPEGLIADMDALLATMDKAGGRKPIWFTEFSYYAADDLPRTPFVPAPNSWSEARFLESERQCAELTVRFFAVMLSHGVEKIFVHSGAAGKANEPHFECAFFEYGGAPRKLVPAMAVLTELLGPKPACAGFRRLGQTGYAAAFETGKQSVIIIWETEEGLRSRLEGSIPGPYVIQGLDLMGRGVAPGKPLSPSPMYMVGPPRTAKELLDSLRLSAETN